MIISTEAAIKQRLEAALVAEAIAGVKVFTADDLSAIEERSQSTPALHVIYGGYTPTQEKGEGRIQEVETQWTIVIAVRSARQGGAAEKADPLIEMAIKYLIGWRPNKDHAPLKLARAPAAAHSPGFSYYPASFTTKETVRAVA